LDKLRAIAELRHDSVSTLLPTGGFVSAAIILLHTLLAFFFHDAVEDVPRFERGPCRPAVNAGERIDCGMLVVRENREAPRSALIRIPVKIFRSRSANPQKDPVLFMLGGPGGSTRNSTGADLPFLENRDYVVFDQRGTRLAEPALECPGFAKTKERKARGLVRESAAEQELIASAAQCAKELRAKGIDLDAYNSRAIAADIEDLRKVLGIEQWNLYGVSYSVHVMLDVMRDYPSTVRSASLDSPLGPESRFDEVAASSQLRALGIVMDACAVSPACARLHPHTRENFAKAVARFDASPQWLALDSAKTDSVLVGGPQLANALVSLLNNRSNAGAIPLFIDRAAEGNIRALAPVFAEEIQTGGYTWGMRLAVWCSEVVPFENRARVESQRDRSLGFAGAILDVIPPAGCDSMKIKPVPEIEGVAVKSDIPTLILSGEIDPYVPTPWARAMLGNMSRAYLVEFRGASHGPGYSKCGQDLINAFYNEPARVPTSDCTAKAQGVVFRR
jgi:pimeloyl-ACP methyl ester carboxylesterase